MYIVYRALLFFCLIISVAGRASGQQLVFASATTGPTNQTSGLSIASEQFLGAIFELNSVTEVADIGGQFFTPNRLNGEMFAVIEQLDSSSSLPTGNPFDSSDLSRIVVSTTITVPSADSLDWVFPVSVTLQPGVYALMYGKGLFGASPDVGLAAGSSPQSLSSHFLVWHDGGAGWVDTGPATSRFTVYGVSVPEPTTAQFLFLIGGLVLVVGWRKPDRNGSGA